MTQREVVRRLKALVEALPLEGRMYPSRAMLDFVEQAPDLIRALRAAEPGVG